MVRALQRSIFGRNCGASLRSSSVQRTPLCPRSTASVRPTGPAPTTSTSVSSTADYNQRVMRIFAVVSLVLLAGTATAQDAYPSRPIHLVVPYTPGTGADILARVLGPKLAERTKAAAVVDNKPGATGNIGADAVAKSPADGYTLLLTATSFTTNPALKP